MDDLCEVDRQKFPGGGQGPEARAGPRVEGNPEVGGGAAAARREEEPLRGGQGAAGGTVRRVEGCPRRSAQPAGK